MQLYATITKIDAEQHLVGGFASTELADDQPGVWEGKRYDGDLITAEAMKGAIADYMAYANLREMHQPSAAGTVLQIEVVEGDVEVAHDTYSSPTYIMAKVVDAKAWQKVETEVYKGFSIGGKALEAHVEKRGGRWLRIITKLLLTEISLVDRPANPGAQILFYKGDHMDEEQIQKASADPGKAVQILQQARNDAELAGDVDSAGYLTQAIALVLLAQGDAKEPDEATSTPAEETAEPAAETSKDDGGDIAMTAKIAKAGRVLSGANTQGMHNVIQGLAKMLAATGDEVATKIMACYGGAGTQKAEQPELVKALSVEIQKLGSQQQPIADALGALSKTLNGIDQRLGQLERQPAPGGPQLRPVEKVLSSTQPAPVETSRTISKGVQQQLDHLQQLAKTAGSHTDRQHYQTQYETLRKQYGG